MVELSVDSGGGTNKSMVRILHEESGQSSQDVILLAEAYSMREKFEPLHRVLDAIVKKYASCCATAIYFREKTSSTVPIRR